MARKLFSSYFKFWPLNRLPNRSYARDNFWHRGRVLKIHMM
jgi:hypothetical protein